MTRIKLITIHHDEFIDDNGNVIPPCDEVIRVKEPEQSLDENDTNVN